MPAEAPFFRDIALVFVAALLGGALAQWVRQPLFVGYVIGGLLVSPFTPGPAVQDVRTFELFAQIGTVGPGFCANVSLEEAAVSERSGVSVLAIRRQDGAEILNPPEATVMRQGDQMTVIGMPDQIALFERRNAEPEARTGRRSP